MIVFFKEGGVAMYFVLGFGAVALLAAFWFAIRPSDAQRGFVKNMGRATLFAVISGMVAGLGAVASAVATYGEGEVDVRRALYGFAESTRPGILGFSLLALVFLLTAVGERRLAARKS